MRFEAPSPKSHALWRRKNTTTKSTQQERRLSRREQVLPKQFLAKSRGFPHRANTRLKPTQQWRQQNDTVRTVRTRSPRCNTITPRGNTIYGECLIYIYCQSSQNQSNMTRPRKYPTWGTVISWGKQGPINMKSV